MRDMIFKKPGIKDLGLRLRKCDDSNVDGGSSKSSFENFKEFCYRLVKIARLFVLYINTCSYYARYYVNKYYIKSPTGYADVRRCTSAVVVKLFFPGLNRAYSVLREGFKWFGHMEQMNE